MYECIRTCSACLGTELKSRIGESGGMSKVKLPRCSAANVLIGICKSCQKPSLHQYPTSTQCPGPVTGCPGSMGYPEIRRKATGTCPVRAHGQFRKYKRLRGDTAPSRNSADSCRPLLGRAACRGLCSFLLACASVSALEKAPAQRSH